MFGRFVPPLTQRIKFRNSPCGPGFRDSSDADPTASPKNGDLGGHPRRSGQALKSCSTRNTYGDDVLSAMADMHDVAILHGILFAFQAQRAMSASVGLGPGLQQLVPMDRLGANEVLG
jgi:hypothetical protein